MSRLFRVLATAQQVCAEFGVAPVAAIGMPAETVEGGRGLIVRENTGRRVLRAVDWGFPRLTAEMRRRGEAPSRTGLVADLTNAMWEQLVVDPRYRCLIPLTHFANPAGEPGARTRTWFALANQPIAAWAGFCRNTPEFGPVFAGMTMTANAAVMPFNDRMPVLLAPDERERWLRGSIADVIAFEFRPPPPAERMVVTASRDGWRSGEAPSECEPTVQATLDLS